MRISDWSSDVCSSDLPLLSIFGGKITTARHMAEEALVRIAEACKWECYRSSRALIFPGGAIAHFEEFLTHVRMFWPFLSESQARRMARAYGVKIGRASCRERGCQYV